MVPYHGLCTVVLNFWVTDTAKSLSHYYDVSASGLSSLGRSGTQAGTKQI